MAHGQYACIGVTHSIAQEEISVVLRNKMREQKYEKDENNFIKYSRAKKKNNNYENSFTYGRFWVGVLDKNPKLCKIKLISTPPCTFLTRNKSSSLKSIIRTETAFTLA